MSLAKTLGMVGVLTSNCRGFIGNRLLCRFLREAKRLVNEGVTVEAVNAAFVQFGMEMGPVVNAGRADSAVQQLIRETVPQSRVKPRNVPSTEIIERILYALINEGARLLEEGIALRAGDIDIVSIYGYGFPAHRGGPMWHADTIGLANVFDRIRQFEKGHGPEWQPAGILQSLAESGRTFADFDLQRRAA